MKNVHGLSLVVGLMLLNACGRTTTTTYWNGTAWVSASGSSSISSAATAATTQIYAVDSDGTVQLFSITAASGHLVLQSVSTTTPAGQAQLIVAGVWTYQVNSATHSIDLCATSNPNVIVESTFVAAGINAIAAK